MPSTYQLISSNVLTSAAASVTFSAIPSTYTDLVLRVSGRDSASGADSGTMNLRINSLATGIYSQTFLYGGGTTAGSARLSSAAQLTVGWGLLDSAGNTSNTFFSSEIYIPSYTASQSKPISAFTVSENNSTAAYIIAEADLFRDNAAVSSISISTTSTYVAGSSFYLYGIKKS